MMKTKQPIDGLQFLTPGMVLIFQLSLYNIWTTWPLTVTLTVFNFLKYWWCRSAFLNTVQKSQNIWDHVYFHSYIGNSKIPCKHQLKAFNDSPLYHTHYSYIQQSILLTFYFHKSHNWDEPQIYFTDMLMYYTYYT